MAITTIYRLAEQTLNIIEGGNPAAADSIDLPELKIACGQVINSLLKTEYLGVNMKLGEVIPNGSVLALYEDIEVARSNGKSQCTLPIKPIKLPRNMGVWAIYPKYTTSSNYDFDNEFIPLQMGQGGLIKSQPILNNLMGQVGYENFGDKIFFTKDIKEAYPDVVVAMRLAIMDISLYGDFDPLPLLPEQEWQVIQEVAKIYTGQPTADKVVDSTSKEQRGIPLTQQKQAE